MAETQQQDPGIKIEGEQVPSNEPNVENKEPQFTAIEQKALEQGWRPKEEWTGDPDDWRDAKAYVDRGEMIGKLKTTNAEIKELKQMLAYMSEHNKKVYVAGYQKAIAELKAQRVAAMKDENFEAVAAIEEAIDQHKDAITQVQRQPTVNTGESAQTKKELEAQWLAQNSWYKTEATMRHWANGMAIDYKRVNPAADDAEIYEFLTKEVKKEFPHKFRKVVAAPNPDGEGRKAESTGRDSKGTSNVESLWKQMLSEMPEDQARAAQSIVKNVPGMTKEKYLKDYGLIKGGR